MLDVLNNLSVRVLLNERATVIAFMLIKKIIVDKKLMSEEEFDKLADEIAHQVDETLSDYLKKLQQAPPMPDSDNFGGMRFS